MSDLVEAIREQLQNRTPDDAIARVCDFLAGLDEYQQRRFLNLLATGPRALVAEAIGLAEQDELLGRIEALYEEIASSEGTEEEPDYDEYENTPGYGNEEWVEELDALFDAATSLFRAGQFAAAAAAYRALFRIFALSGEQSYYTYAGPSLTVRADLDAMAQNMFVAIGESNSEPGDAAIDASEATVYAGGNRFALLDAWQDHPAWLAALEATLIERGRTPNDQNQFSPGLQHAMELLREIYRRYRSLAAWKRCAGKSAHSRAGRTRI
jgi:hypothetical protein